MPTRPDVQAATPKCPKSGNRAAGRMVVGRRCATPLLMRAGAWWCTTHGRVKFGEVLAAPEFERGR